MASLALGVGLPLLLKATGADKKIIQGIRDTPRNLAKAKKQLGFKHGGMVTKTGKHLVHKGEYVIPKKEVDKMKKMAKQMKAKPKAKSKK
jgi:hypothetical protein